MQWCRVDWHDSTHQDSNAGARRSMWQLYNELWKPFGEMLIEMERTGIRVLSDMRSHTPSLQALTAEALTADSHCRFTLQIHTADSHCRGTLQRHSMQIHTAEALNAEAHCRGLVFTLNGHRSTKIT